MSEKQELPVVGFATPKEWRAWLEENHGASAGLWLRFARAGSGVPSVTYVEAVEESLCYGWIDGQTRKLDETYWLQRYTPRRPKSKWSKINRDRATKLLGRGLMAPAGLREVERAKADGRWEAAYDGPRTATVPDDLQEALEQNPQARRFFETLDSQNRYAILYRLQDAKRPETRARRLQQFVAMLNEGKKLH